MIIGIMANGPRAGKTTTAGFLSSGLLDHHLTPVVCPFAEEVKRIARLLGWDGVKDERGRLFLNDLGMGARAYDKDVWVKLWRKNNDADLFDPTITVLVDDVRFPNEVDTIKNLGGKIIYVEKEGVERPDLESEGYQLRPQEYDGYFTNNKKPESLQAKISAWLEVYV